MGVQRSGRAVLAAMDALAGEAGAAPGLSMEVLIPPDVDGDLGLRHLGVRRIGTSRGHLWEQTELAMQARRGVLLSLCNTAPISLARQVVVLHDASVFAVPHAYSGAFRTWYRVMFRGLAGRARAVVTDSEFSRTELLRFGLGTRERIHVVPLGAEHILAAPADTGVCARLEEDGRPFVLAVGSEAAHKNIALLERVMAAGTRDYRLVIVGQRNDRVFGAGSGSAERGVLRLGYVTDAELRALYERALCLVFPSRYEGFGLPPLEAMACGCPVVVSRAASLPEVCGDAALYCDPDDAEGFARAIARVAAEPSLRDDLISRGRAQAARFTWRSAARSVIALLAEQANS